MVYKIIWSPKAKDTYYQILEYLESNWSNKEVNDFVNRTEEVLAFIAANPSQYIKSVKADIHKSVLVKQVSLFYRIKPNIIELLLFWDNRQDPSKLKL
jgi:plasmid stabilization system protein ParE